MCACRCGINLHLKDSRVCDIEGNPNQPVAWGAVCAKGSAGTASGVSYGLFALMLAGLRRGWVHRGPVSRSRDGVILCFDQPPPVASSDPAAGLPCNAPSGC
jgi:hypothetical protein